MSRRIPAWAGWDGKYFRIADPIFPIRALAISFALVLIRVMNSRIIVLIQSMFRDILSRLVDLRNSGYFWNFIRNGARKTVCLSDNERARHGRDQIPVLRGDLVQKSGWRVEGAAWIFKEQTPARRTIVTVMIPHVWWYECTAGTGCLRGTVVHDFLRVYFNYNCLHALCNAHLI